MPQTWINNFSKSQQAGVLSILQHPDMPKNNLYLSGANWGEKEPLEGFFGLWSGDREGDSEALAFFWLEAARRNPRGWKKTV